MRVEPPVYQAGYIGKLNGMDEPPVLSIHPRLPWSSDDPAALRMGKLMDAVENEFSRIDRPDLATTLDSYLEMLWSLGLSAPVQYVDCHPFDLQQQGGHLKLYWITRERGRGQEIRLRRGQTVREAVREQVSGNPALTDGAGPGGEFRVLIDGVELRRPIRFKFQKTEKRGLDFAVLFVGKYEPNLSEILTSQRGGDLSLEAYLFWTGRVVPKENNGVLIRIRGASGALFDPTFFKYQVSEQTRLRQITSELLVHSGLDAALNIDRESFNFAHPHVQLVTIWLHHAIRLLTNRLKDEAARLRQARRDEDATAGRDLVNSVAAEVWHRRRGAEPVPEVVFADSDEEAQTARGDGSIALTRSGVSSQSMGAAERATREAQTAALTQVLAAFGVLEDRSYQEQQELIRAILDLFLGVAQ